MFRSPEHALAVAYGISAPSIEPKNATQLVLEMLRDRFRLQQHLSRLFGEPDWRRG